VPTSRSQAASNQNYAIANAQPSVHIQNEKTADILSLSLGTWCLFAPVNSQLAEALCGNVQHGCGLL
jgi:hypothetical protein